MLVKPSPTPILFIVLNASWICVYMKVKRGKISPLHGGSGGGMIGARIASQSNECRVHRTHQWPLSLYNLIIECDSERSYFEIYPRIMTNIGKSSLSDFVRYLCSTIECNWVRWLIWAQELIIQEPILTQEFNLNQVKARESKLVQELGPNQKIKTLVHIFFPQ